MLTIKFQSSRMFAIRFLSVLGLAASAMAVCTNPKVTASSYTPSDSQVLAAIPFIAEFKLACDGGETPALYADIDGVLMPVTKSAEGEKYQVSWTQEVKKASTGDRSVALYDTEGFTALRKSRALGQASTVSPLVTIVIPYPGSYSGPWLNSEHLAAALAAAVFYLAFSSRSSLLA
jgi:translocon-associated protein subunit delta